MWRTIELLEASIGKTIKARFPGSCPVCGKDVKKGDKISVINKVWMHQQCAKDVASGKKSLPSRGRGSQSSGMGPRFGQTYRRGGGTASSSRKATSKQVRYAMSLIHRLGSHGWHDSDYGHGMSPPTEKELKTWSSKDVSDLISSLRAEF